MASQATIVIPAASPPGVILLSQLEQGPQGPAGVLTALTINSIVGSATVAPAWFAINEITCTAGAVTLNIAANSNGAIMWLKFLAGNPATHNITINPPSGKMIEGILGAYCSGSPTIPGTYYASLTFQTSTDVGSAISLYQNSGGNIAASPL
jgi:hypothetical protein